MNIQARKVLFISIFWGFLTFVFPGFMHQGVVYCNDLIPVKNAASCSQTNIQSGNIEFYVRYFAVAILFLLVGIIMARRKDFNEQKQVALLFLLPGSLVITLVYSWLAPPLVMYPQGELFAYVSHVPDAPYVLAILLTSIIGLAFGISLMGFVKKEKKTTT